MRNVRLKILTLTGLDVSSFPLLPSTFPIRHFGRMSMLGDITFLLHTSYLGANLAAYIEGRTIRKARVDDTTTLIMDAWLLAGQESPLHPPINFNALEPEGENG